MAYNAQEHSFEEKIRLAGDLFPTSPAFRKYFGFSEEQWQFFLGAWEDEDLLDHLLLLAIEERSMMSDIEKTKKRKLKVNRTRLVQKMQGLQVQAEQALNPEQ